MSVNRALLIGRLGQDPEKKTFDSGRTLTSFSIATNESWKDKVSGEPQKRTEWHRIVAWGKTAEAAHRCLAKGRQVFVEGKLQTRKWNDKEGKERHTTEVVAQTLTFLDSPREAETAPQLPLEDANVPF